MKRSQAPEQPKNKAKPKDGHPCHVMDLFHLQNRITALEKKVLRKELANISQPSRELLHLQGRLTAFEEIVSGKKMASLPLSESESWKMNTMVHNFPGMIYRCANDDNLSLEFASPGCADLLGLPAGVLLGMPKFFLNNFIHPEDERTVREQIEQSILQYKPFRLIYRVVDKSGREKWVVDQGKGIYSDTGNLLWVDGAMFDLSHLEFGKNRTPSVWQFVMNP